jgi:pyruvate/2-oxoglutarate dehydrogenase complex dihydrolipoamide dehydrogenase (E3) component
VRTAARFHVDGHGDPTVNLPAIVADKNALVAEHRAEALGNARRATSLTLIEGDARFVSPRGVAVGERRLSADRIFIATGMRPLIPDLPGIGDVEVHTNETLMDLTGVPEHLVVLGGGYIGCELGQAYRRFGSEVTIIHGPGLLCADEEPDVSRLLAPGMRADGIELVTDHRAVRVAPAGDGVRVIARADDGSRRTIDGSHLLVAGGRRPNTDTLDLAAAGVAARSDGSIVVDGRLRTNVAGIWAVGDVNGEQPFTRVCQEEAKVAYADAFEGADVRIDHLSLGHGIFTDPEIGSVGLTEAEAKARGYDVRVGTFPFGVLGRAKMAGEIEGFVKIVGERKYDELLGVHMIGLRATELVAEATVALRLESTVEEISRTIHAHPTMSEAVGEAAHAAHGAAVHM